MNYTIEQFHADVAAEAKALREHATKEELGRLDFYTLIPDDISCCIFGQMTGDCDSERASELIKSCASVYFETWSQLSSIKKEFKEYYWSPIEAYICYASAKTKNLIAYLRGESDDLVL